MEDTRSNQPQPSILVVDDDEALVATFQKFFEIKKFSVDTACNGCDAAAKIATGSYDVALIDVALPDMKGTDLLPMFKRMIPGTRKIVLTGYANTENAMEAVNKGASFFMTKPIKLGVLFDVVSKQLEERAMELRFMQEKSMELFARKAMQS